MKMLHKAYKKYSKRKNNQIGIMEQYYESFVVQFLYTNFIYFTRIYLISIISPKQIYFFITNYS